MGLFSTRYRTVVSTTAERVYPERLVPDSFLTGMVLAIRDDAENADLVANVGQAVYNGLGMNIERFASWAKTNYVYGTPMTGILTETTDVLKAALATAIPPLASGEFVLLHKLIGQWNLWYAAWLRTFELGYWPPANTVALSPVQRAQCVYVPPPAVEGVLPLPAPAGPPLVESLYLQDIEILIPATGQWSGTWAAESLIPFGPAPKSLKTPIRPMGPSTREAGFADVVVTGSVSVPALRLTLVYALVGSDVYGTPRYVTVQFTASLPLPDGLAAPTSTVATHVDYVQLMYARPNIGIDTLQYPWHYRVGAGTYPAIDALYDGFGDTTTDNDFLPNLYFRLGKQDLSSGRNLAPALWTEAYRDSLQACRMLGLDFNQISDQIHANPDIDDLENAMLMFGVEMGATSEWEQAYLFDFWLNLYGAAGDGGLPIDWGRSFAEVSDVSGQLNLEVLQQVAVEPWSFLVNDAIFKLGIQFEALFKRSVAGTIPQDPDLAPGVPAPRRLHSITFDPAKRHAHPAGVRRWDADTSSFVEIDTAVVLARPTWTIRRADPNAPGLVTEIDVVNPSTVFHVFGDYHVIGNADQPAIHLVPLDHGIAKAYPIREREKLYARSMHFVFNSRTDVPVKWYQQQLFKVVMIVVAIALTVYSAGQSLGPLLSATTTAAVAAAAFALAVKLVAVIAVRYALRWVASELGAEFVAVLALVMTAVATYQLATTEVAVDAMASASTTTATTTTVTPATFQLAMPDARQLLEISSSLLDAGQQAVKRDIADLQREWADVEASQEAAWGRLEEASASLEASRPHAAIESAIELQRSRRIAPFVIPGESPRSYFARTVHAGNLGQIGVDLVARYVDTALRLPTPAITTFDEFAAFNDLDPNSVEQSSTDPEIS